MTPPEIEAYREDKSLPNTPGWLIRVIPNKFPALQIEGDLDKRGVGVFDMSGGIGAHEVIIETPEHNKTTAELTDVELQRVIWTYQNRGLDLHKDMRIKYSMIFKNQGDPAGASLEHPHSQLIALPMIPKNVHEELVGAKSYYEYKERCIFCDMIRQEIQEKERLIAENKRFLNFSPFVSRFPFEMWIIPKQHRSDFCTIQKEEISDLTKILKDALMRIKILLSDPSYNFIIHTSPFEDGDRADYHWHIEIMPRLMRVAGFEWGTGFYVNPTPPEIAAKYLKEVK
jgi:UDPglucose--hexose-1-phosphate uridylyltransferase